MKSIQAEYNEASREITIKKDANVEDWVSVCRRFNDDVSRICDVTDMEEYTGLFECFDDQNNKHYYLVKEDKALHRMKRRHFYENLGID
ncbi:hypothetical protein [uncultured Desulfobacter sp.]|uniref:hypothetical protein n=1 Tax=uncultured Desulfobacter sp. TaxID=240139 RepID=UPI0029F49253|nr:hypothetical protein [uncultured Desulfobacter sp.]